MISRYLFPLLPPALFLGPFFADGILCLIGLNYLYVNFKMKNFKFYKNLFTTIFIIFYLYILSRSLLSDNILLSLESSLFYFRYLFFVGGTLYLFKNYPNFLRYFFVASLISILFVSFNAYLQIFFEINLIGDLSKRADRLVLYQDELILGSYLSRMLIITIPIFFFYYNKSYLRMIIFSIFAIPVLIAIAYSGERTALFIISFSILILIILFDTNFSKKILFFLIFISSLIIILFHNEEVKTRMINETLTGFVSDQNNQRVIFTNIHHGHLTSAYQMFLDNKLFGHGTKTYRIKCSEKKYLDDYSCSTHPHNTYLQLLAETGLIGFLFIFISFFMCLKILLQNFIFQISKKIYLNYELRNNQIAILICLFVTLWPIMPSNNFFNNYISVFYYIPIPLLIFFLKDKFNNFKTLYDSV